MPHGLTQIERDDPATHARTNAPFHPSIAPPPRFPWFICTTKVTRITKGNVGGGGDAVFDPWVVEPWSGNGRGNVRRGTGNGRVGGPSRLRIRFCDGSSCCGRGDSPQSAVASDEDLRAKPQFSGLFTSLSCDNPPVYHRVWGAVYVAGYHCVCPCCRRGDRSDQAGVAKPVGGWYNHRFELTNVVRSAR